jgi:hypothetical protein
MFGTDFADVDNDGDLDIGANSFGFGAGIHVYLNQGDGTWSQSFGFIGGNSQDDFVFGDVNKDGNSDFIVAHQLGTVYIGDGTGSFSLGDGNLPPPGIVGYSGPDFGDVDNDGGDDLSFANSSGGVEVWEWESMNNWIDFSGSLPDSGPYEATQLFDMDVDGFVDLAAFGRGEVKIWSGDGMGGWSEVASFTTPGPGYFEAFRVGGDADHNGYPDIVLVSEEGSWPNEQNHLRFFKESSVPGSLWVKSIYPRGYEKYYPGSIHFIDWISGVPDIQPAFVKLELSTTGSGGPWILIADSLGNNGRYQWTVPGTPSPDCFIRYTIIHPTGSDTAFTPAPFEILLITGVSESPTALDFPGVLLGIPYPNPLNGSVSIPYSLEKSGETSLQIYDLSGKLVRTLVDQMKEPGHYSLIWDGRNDRGENLASGIFYVQLKSQNVSRSRKIVLLK